jgi:hypothetical protein
MKMNLNRCFIIGSGNSLSEGISDGLWDILSTEITFGINEIVRFFDSTVAVVGDWTAYRDRYEYFSKHPLVISRWQRNIGFIENGKLLCPKQTDLILLSSSGKFHSENALKKGLYTGVLTGAFTLNLAIVLGFKEIFLLGFDNREINGKTHFYQGLNDYGIFRDAENQLRTGVGKDSVNNYKTSVYNHTDKELNKIWEPFSNSSHKIFNVSPLSRITIFTKIDYNYIFNYIKTYPIEINQDIERQEIRRFLDPYNVVSKQ